MRACPLLPKTGTIFTDYGSNITYNQGSEFDVILQVNYAKKFHL